jgi:hypothetical protein
MPLRWIFNIPRHSSAACCAACVLAVASQVSFDSMSRRPRSAALFERQTRPCSRNRVKLGPTLQDVVERLGQVVPAGQSSKLLTPIDLKVLDQGPAQRLPNLEAFLGIPAIDGALDLEQHIDPTTTSIAIGDMGIFPTEGRSIVCMQQKRCRSEKNHPRMIVHVV